MSKELYQRLHNQVTSKIEQLGTRQVVYQGIVKHYIDAIRAEFGPADWGWTPAQSEFLEGESFVQPNGDRRFDIRVKFVAPQGGVVHSVVVPFLASMTAECLKITCLATAESVDVITESGFIPKDFIPAVKLLHVPVVDGVGEFIST